MKGQAEDLISSHMTLIGEVVLVALLILVAIAILSGKFGGG